MSLSSNPDSLVCSFNDADIYVRDLRLFQSRQWLNDACINVCLRLIEENQRLFGQSPEAGRKILLLDPAVASFLRLQCSEPDEFQEFFVGNALGEKLFVCVPVNDNQSFESSSSHWSLLIMYTPTHEFWHFDSHGGHNNESARAFAQILCSCFAPGITDRLKFSSVACAQQRNGYDCGIYTLLHLTRIYELLIQFLSSSAPQADVVESSMDDDSFKVIFENWIQEQQRDHWSTINETTAAQYRQQKFTEIRSLGRS